MADNKNKTDLPPVYILPSDAKELQNFSKKFKVDMMKQVVKIIDFAVKHNLPLIEVFQFKNSDFVITLAEKDYLSNLENAYKYFLDNEVYENCSEVIRLQSILKSRLFETIPDENKTHHTQQQGRG
jgi:hypothetical protein